MTKTLRLVALLFCVLGGFLLRIGLADPNADVPKPVRTGTVAAVEFGEARTLGRFMTVTLEGDPERFQVTLLGRVAGLEERLRERVQPGASVSIAAVVRDPKNWATPDGVPLPILALQRGDEVLIDSATFETRFGRMARGAAPVAGAIAVLLGVALFALSVSLARQTA